MDWMAILALVAKGVSVVEMLIAAAKDAGPALTVIKNVITGAQMGTITQEELLALEDILDAQIAEFNEPLPE